RFGAEFRGELLTFGHALILLRTRVSQHHDSSLGPAGKIDATHHDVTHHNIVFTSEWMAWT
ncbi:hypothetical protein, partial [Glutamicibacter protophormiae]|uniref:hypothetical protein n=1 Tax=Glutamicibacter protophormiae TaxID=37930 RepID=UPI003331081B